jgi:hypothetical protein
MTVSLFILSFGCWSQLTVCRTAALFVDVPHPSISWIYASIGCQHTLQPTNDEYKPPSIPALTTKGFVRWQSIEILLGPEEHVPFIQFAVINFGIKNPDTGEPFPKELHKESFPARADPEIEKWHNQCAEKLRQQATPNEDDEGSRPDLPPRPKVRTAYSHVQPSVYASRVRSSEARDYFDPKRRGSRTIPYQHVSGARPVRPVMSHSPSHRSQQFLAPEAPGSPRISRSRRRSFPENMNGSPITSPNGVTSPNLEPPLNSDHVRRHSHPRQARRGSYSSDASSEPDEPPSPRNVNIVAGTRPIRRAHTTREGDLPSVRFPYPSPNISPNIPPLAVPLSPRSREQREREEEEKRRSLPIPIDLSGKLSAPFLLGKRERERAPKGKVKLGWKDLSDVQEWRMGSKSSEEERMRDGEVPVVGRRGSRAEDNGNGNGNGRDYKRRERDKDGIRGGGNTRQSSDDYPRRERDREREREREGGRDPERTLRDRDRERRGASPVRGVDGRYYPTR